MQSTEHLNIAPNSTDLRDARDFHIVSGGKFNSHYGQPIIASTGFWAARIISEKGERQLYVGGVGRRNNSAIKSFVQAELERHQEPNKLHIEMGQDSVLFNTEHGKNKEVRSGAGAVHNHDDAERLQARVKRQQAKNKKTHAEQVKFDRLFPKHGLTTSKLN